MTTQTDTNRRLITELQSRGLRLVDESVGAPSRRGGAGPSDHKAVTVDGQTVMVPVHSSSAAVSPFEAGASGADGRAVLTRDGVRVGDISFPTAPRFYRLQTLDGVPYWKIAQLHGTDVLATTVLQTCVRYGRRATSCQFCAIGESLAAVAHAGLQHGGGEHIGAMQLGDLPVGHAVQGLQAVEARRLREANIADVGAVARELHGAVGTAGAGLEGRHGRGAAVHGHHHRLAVDLHGLVVGGPGAAAATGRARGFVKQTQPA